MPRYDENKFLPYSPQQLFQLVADVEKYPEFVPWCKDVQIKERKENHLLVNLTAGNSFLSETYTSDVYLTPNKKVEVAQNDGPFKYLFNTWTFEPTEEGTEISFKIEFEFNSYIFQKAIESVFMEAATHMIQAFEERAEGIFGIPPKKETQLAKS